MGEEEARIEGGPYIVPETARRLACDASVVEMAHDPDGGVLDVGRKRRSVPPALRRALDRRDGGCRFPGCGSRFCDAHHVVPWAAGGETTLENLVLLCRHHHRRVHEDGWSVELENGGGARATVRVRDPGGRPVPGVPPAPGLPSRPVRALERDHAELGLDVRADISRWEGHPMDVDLALAHLAAVEAKAGESARVAEATRTGEGGERDGTTPPAGADVSAETRPMTAR